MSTEFDDDSDLTSLEDEAEPEQRVDNVVARDNGALQSDSESSLTSIEDDETEGRPSNSQNDSRNVVLPTPTSPSRIGSSLSRPTLAKGIRTYGGRKSRVKRPLKKQGAAKHSPEPPPEPSGYESPLTPLPSPSPRKRRASPSPQTPLSSPSKRSRNRKSRETNPASIVESVAKPMSARKPPVNGHTASPSFAITPTKRKYSGKQTFQNKTPALHTSATPRRRNSPSKSRRTTESTWSVEALGPLVWLRVDRDNNVANDSTTESFWWPAKMEPTSARQKTIRVRIFSPPSGTAESLLAIVAKPSPSNILSYKDRAYTASSFWLLPPSSASSQPSGFDELRSHWEEACRRIVEEDVRLNDGFPTSLTALLSQRLVHTDGDDDDSASQVAPERPAVLSSLSTTGEPWIPPPPDPNITIPGEYVLCSTKTKGYTGKFYPAKVIAYIPPSSPNVPPLYKVHFMDNFGEDVTRDMFYIYEQDEFGTCKLGPFESVESLYERDGEAEPEEDTDTLSETNNHIVIPDIPLLPPPPPEDFCGLTIPEQSSYIIPILSKIVENKYKPAEKRVSAFLNGGRERTNVSKDAPQKGFLTRSELNQLARIVKRWALSLDSPSNGKVRDANASAEIDVRRPEQDAPIPPEETDVRREGQASPDDLSAKETTCLSQDKEQEPSLPPSSLPPSSTIDESPGSTLNGVGRDDHGIIVAGSPLDSISQPNAADQRLNNGNTSAQPSASPKRTFKDLLSHEKIHFCTDVLLKEAVIQLLLWRAGKRCSIDLLSETEELLLHESGSNLAGEFDIAHTIQDLRAKKEKILAVRMQSKQLTPTGGTRSRPRKT